MPSEIHKLSFLHILESVVLVIASLYWARAVFVPLALALMLTFLLQPVVAVLHRRGARYPPPPGVGVLPTARPLWALGRGGGGAISNPCSRVPPFYGQPRP